MSPAGSGVSARFRSGVTQALGLGRNFSAGFSWLQTLLSHQSPERGPTSVQEVPALLWSMVHVVNCAQMSPGMTSLPQAPATSTCSLGMPACQGWKASLPGTRASPPRSLWDKSGGQGAGRVSYYFYSCHQILGPALQPWQGQRQPGRRTNPQRPGRQGRGCGEEGTGVGQGLLGLMHRCGISCLHP